MPQVTSTKTSGTRIAWYYPLSFILVAVIGLFIVKWSPYYDKAFVAATTHSIGASIITGKTAAAPTPSWESALAYATTYFTAVWKAVILGLLLGSLVQVVIPQDWIRRTLGGKGFGSTALAGAASLPGMMCSCCAAPVAVGLRAQSASVGAALAFFLGNPVLNPATIIFMGFVLSWKFAILRVVAGLILVFGSALIADRLVDNHPVPNEIIPHLSPASSSLFSRWMQALWRLVIDTIPAYLIVVLALGAARAWLFPAVGAEWHDGIITLIFLAFAGTLFVIPTAAEIPIVQTLMSFGLGVGPAVALLMTLPAVSLPSLLIVKRVFPAKILFFVAAAVAIVGVVSGLVAQVLF